MKLVVHFFQLSLAKAFQFDCFYCFSLKIVQEVEMGETPLRNSQLQAVIGAGMLPDSSCSGTYSTLTPSVLPNRTALVCFLSNFWITFFSYDAKFPISLSKEPYKFVSFMVFIRNSG